MEVAGVGRAAERAPRRRARIVGAQPAAHEVVLEQRKMRVNFARKIALALTRMHCVEEPPQ